MESTGSGGITRLGSFVTILDSERAHSLSTYVKPSETNFSGRIDARSVSQREMRSEGIPYAGPIFIYIYTHNYL